MRGGSEERPGGWDGGGVNDDGGGNGDGDGNTHAMARHQKRVAYKEDNTLLPGDGGSDAQLFPVLARIGNGERNYLPSKPKKNIPPKKKKKFGREKTGKNKNPHVAQLSTINASNATPLRPQRPTGDKDNPAAGFCFSGRQGILLKQSRTRPIRYLSYSPI